MLRIPAWLNPKPKTGADAGLLDRLTALSNVLFLYPMAFLFALCAL